MKKIVTLFIVGMFVVAGCIACGNRNVLEGEWEIIDYQIDEQTQEIDYEIVTITFEENRVKWNNKNYLYEISESKDSVLIKNDSSEKEYVFDVNDNSLAFDGDIYYKKESKEYKKYKEEIETEAEKKLEELKEKIKKEEKLAEEKDKAIKKATELWEEKAKQFIEDYNAIVGEKNQQLEQEVLKVLNGKWNYKHPARTETYTFTGATFVNYRDWGFRKASVDGTVKVMFTPVIDCSQLDIDALKGDSLTTDVKLKVIQSSPFSIEWNLKDLKNAETYITHCFDILYEQMNGWKDITLEKCKSSSTNIISIVLMESGKEYGSINIQTLSSNAFTLVTDTSEYAIYR